MGRQAGIDTANSEIFFMRASARRLDHDYAVWGRVVQGLDVVRAIKVGEPPADPDRMIRVRLAAELPAAERPRGPVTKIFSPALAPLRNTAPLSGHSPKTVTATDTSRPRVRSPPTMGHEVITAASAMPR